MSTTSPFTRDGLTYRVVATADAIDLWQATREGSYEIYCSNLSENASQDEIVGAMEIAINTADESDAMDREISHQQENLTDLVQRVLEILDWSNAKLAREIGVSPTSVNSMVKGHLTDSGMPLIRLHDFLNKKNGELRKDADEIKRIYEKLGPLINRMM